MRAAPAVSVRCSGGLPWRLLNVLLPALAVAVGSVWLLSHLEQAPAWAAVPAVLAGGLAWRLARPRAVLLVFDGQRWTCDDAEGFPELMLDLDRALLLRWRPATGAARWIPLHAAEAGGALHSLRVALYAPQPAGAAAQT